MNTAQTFSAGVAQAVARGTDPLYSFVYFYGAAAATAALADTIAGEYKAQHPHRAVMRMSERDFNAYLLHSVANNVPRRPFSATLLNGCGLFIFEDVEAVAGKELEEEELFGILDECMEHGIRVVVTGRAPLAWVTGLVPRIRTQLEGGISVAAEPAP